MDTEIKEYADDLKEYAKILKGYKDLPDTAFEIAYTLAQDAISLADRFSEIHFELRKSKQLTVADAAALKDLIQAREKRLKEIHIHCRMIWNKGREFERGAGT